MGALLRPDLLPFMLSSSMLHVTNLLFVDHDQIELVDKVMTAAWYPST